MAETFNFSAVLNFSDLERSADSAWSRAQGYLNKKPLRIKFDDGISTPLGRITAGVGNFEKAIDASTKRVIAFGLTAGIFVKLKQGFDEFVTSTINVQNAITKIGIGLNTSSKNLQTFSAQMFNIARQTGKTYEETAQAAEKLSKQNLGTAETLKRLRDSLILSRIAGIDVADSVKDITAALNTFKKEGLDSTAIIDRFAAVQNKLGISSDVFADAIERSGETAQVAGVSFNKLLGYITAVQTITQRGGASVGTTLNTIFEKIEKPEVREKLNSFLIATRDQKGNKLSGDQVIQNIAQKINPQNQSKLLELVAGDRQENNAIALLGELAKQNNLVAKSMDAIGDSAGSAAAQNQKFNGTLDSLIKSAKTTFTQLSSAVGNKTLSPSIRTAVGGLDSVRNFLTGGDSGKGFGKNIGNGLLEGITNVLTGPGAALIGTVLYKAVSKAFKFAGSDLKELLGINNISRERQVIQEQINKLLSQATEQEKQSYLTASTLIGRKNELLAIQIRINEQVQKQEEMTAGIAEIGGLSMGGKKKNFAGGYGDAIAAEKSDIASGVGGASASAKPVIVPRFNFGSGRVEGVVANSDEHIVRNFSEGGGDAIFNKNMVSKYGLPSGAKHLSKGFIRNFADGHDEFHDRVQNFMKSLTPDRQRRFLNNSKGQNNAQVERLMDYYSRIGKSVFINTENSSSKGEFSYGDLRTEKGHPLKKNSQELKGLNELFDNIKSAANVAQAKDFKGQIKQSVEGLNEASKSKVLQAFKRETAIRTRTTGGPTGIFGVENEKKVSEKEVREAMEANSYQGTNSMGALEANAVKVNELKLVRKKRIQQMRSEGKEALEGQNAAEGARGKIIGLSFIIPLLAGIFKEAFKGSSIFPKEGSIGDKLIGAGEGALTYASTAAFLTKTANPYVIGAGAIAGAYLGYRGAANRAADNADSSGGSGGGSPPIATGGATNPSDDAGSIKPGSFSKYSPEIGAIFNKAGNNRNPGGIALTSIQRAQRYVDFYENLSKESGVDINELQGNPEDKNNKFLKNQRLITETNTLKYAANFLKGVNPAGRYEDSRGNPLNLSISQGLDIASKSSNADESSEAKSLLNYLNRARKDTGSDKLGAPLGSVTYDGTVVGSDYSTVGGDSKKHDYIKGNNPNLITNKEKAKADNEKLGNDVADALKQATQDLKDYASGKNSNIHVTITVPTDAEKAASKSELDWVLSLVKDLKAKVENRPNPPNKVPKFFGK